MSDTQRSVLVVGPNPAMDIVYEVAGFRLGTSRRAIRTLRMAGGKPVNVSRTLRRLGIDVCLISPLGGHLGARALIEERCQDLGIDLRAVEIRDETRMCVVVADTETGDSSVINELGPQLSVSESEAYGALVSEALRSGGIVLASGSLPPGLAPGFYANLVTQSVEIGAHVIVDTSGEPLRLALEAGPWAVKVNGDELLAVTGGSTVQEAAQSLAKRVDHVVVTLGAEGVLYVGIEGALRAAAVPLTPTNVTGAGDAFLAGLTAELLQGGSWPDALRLGTATAGLACGRLEPDIGPDPPVREMMNAVELFPL